MSRIENVFSKRANQFLQFTSHTGPHFHSGERVNRIMFHVIMSLMPIVFFSVYLYGLSVVFLLLVCILGCVLTEYFFVRRFGKPALETIQDFSVILTGLLLALTLPPGFPLWMAFVGSIVSVCLGKWMMGGLGQNVFNPALVGRVFLQAAFPAAMTSWSEPLVLGRFSNFIPSSLSFPFTYQVSAWTGATPLASMKYSQDVVDIGHLFWGSVAGSSGESSALLILVGGLYLAYQKYLDWKIPVGILMSVWLLTTVIGLFSSQSPDPFAMLFSGGLFLGAFYMATDMVTSPVTYWGIWAYSVLIGVLVVVIRLWSGLPEGVMFAILIGNSLSPLFNQFFPSVVYGHRRRFPHA